MIIKKGPVSLSMLYMKEVEFIIFFFNHREDAFSLRFVGSAGCTPTLRVIKRRRKSLWSCIEMQSLGEKAFISAFVVDSKD